MWAQEIVNLTKKLEELIKDDMALSGIIGRLLVECKNIEETTRLITDKKTYQ